MRAKQALFEPIYRKLKAELAGAEVEARLRRKLMVKKSKARIVAVVAVVTTLAALTNAGAKARRLTAEEDIITNEVSSKVMSITFRFAGLP